jgi:hypothetical protein
VGLARGRLGPPHGSTPALSVLHAPILLLCACVCAGCTQFLRVGVSSDGPTPAPGVQVAVNGRTVACPASSGGGCVVGPLTLFADAADLVVRVINDGEDGAGHVDWPRLGGVSLAVDAQLTQVCASAPPDAATLPVSSAGLAPRRLDDCPLLYTTVVANSTFDTDATGWSNDNNVNALSTCKVCACVNVLVCARGVGGLGGGGGGWEKGPPALIVVGPDAGSVVMRTALSRKGRK